MAAFQSGLNELGYIEGRNVMIEYRSAEGHPDRLPPLVDDLVRRQVAVLVANSTASALAAKSVTSNLPIVFLIGGDPVELGLIASLNRPGGNATGVSFLVNKLVAKRLELLSELAPGAVTLGMLVDPNKSHAEPDTKDAQVAADALGRKLLVVKAAAESELDAAFTTLIQMQVANLFVDGNVNFITWRDQIMALAMRYGIAASYATRDFVMAGGLMSYGPDWQRYGAKSAFMQAESLQRRQARRHACDAIVPSSSLSSISGPQRRRLLQFHQPCWRSPTR